MPEEVNRVVTDHISTLLLCPTRQAIENLKKEGCTEGVVHIGDVMYDAALMIGEFSGGSGFDNIRREYDLGEEQFVLTTIHRPQNTDQKERLELIFKELKEIAEEIPVLFPIHPRTRAKAEEFGLLNNLGKVRLARPIGYVDMVHAEKEAGLIITDSGGIQKEAYFHRTPCLTVRGDTEWVETVEFGWNRLVEPGELVDGFRSAKAGTGEISDYGSGDACAKLVAAMEGWGK